MEIEKNELREYLIENKFPQSFIDLLEECFINGLLEDCIINGLLIIKK